MRDENEDVTFPPIYKKVEILRLGVSGSAFLHVRYGSGSSLSSKEKDSTSKHWEGLWPGGYWDWEYTYIITP